MWPHRTALTCSQSSAGRAASVAKARTAACRFDISSAAGMPLPTTSAIDSATRLLARSGWRRSSRRRRRTPAATRRPARSRPSAAASRAAGSAGCGGLPRARAPRAAPARGARGRPAISVRSSATSAALSQGFCTKSRTPRRMASTARSIEPQPVITTTGSDASSAWRRDEQIDALAARRRVAGVVQIHQHQIEAGGLRPPRARRRANGPRRPRSLPASAAAAARRPDRG